MAAYYAQENGHAVWRWRRSLAGLRWGRDTADAVKKELIVAALLCLSAAGTASVTAQTLAERSISSSKQFIIYGSDRTLRARVSIGAEDVKRDLLSTLKRRDGWKYPILMNLDAKIPARQRNPPRYQLRPLEVEGGAMNVQIDVFDTAGEKGGDGISANLRKLVLEALLLELSYRETKLVGGKAYVSPPRWVVEGLDEMFRAKDTGLQAGIFSRLISSGKPPRLEELFRQRTERLDAASLALYRAQSFALLQTLLELPDGPRGVMAYLSYPRRSPSSTADLAAFFPSLGKDPASLARKWLLSLARASASRRVELLSVRETAQLLDKTLAGVRAAPDPRNPAARLAGPAALQGAARSQGGKFAMQQLSEELLRIEVRAHPVFRPLIEEYRKIATDLSIRPKKKLEKQIAGAEEMRKALSKHVAELDDYMDWFEAAKLSGAPAKLGESIDTVEEMEEPVRRADAISKHLDLIEERGW